MTEADAAAGGGSSATKKQQQSKRQRRKHVNPSNTWPQQPKIQSAEARAKANLRVAGLSTTTTTPTNAALDPKLDLHSPEVRFCRFLGAPEQRKRHLAVTNLQAYLKKRSDIESTTGISEMDLLKLWKGLWFTLYLADKVPVQEELAKRLAKLIWCVSGTEEEDEYAAQMYLDFLTQQDEDVIMENVADTVENVDDDDDEHVEEQYNEGSDEEQDDEDSVSDEQVEPEQRLQEQDEEEEEEEEIPDELVQHCRGAHLAALFVKTFFRTIRREWGKMDKHRIDKFYTLVRLMLREIFSYMAARHWNRGIVFLFNDILREEILFQVPNGLRLHLIDITMEELATVNMKAPMSLTEATFLDCLDPYFALAQNSDDSMVHGRVMENIFAKFLDEYCIVSENEESEKVMDQVHVGTIAKFLFELGSDVDTQERYRKPLYDMHKKYMKRLKKVGKDVELDIGDSPDEAVDATEEDDIVEDVQVDEAKPKKRKRIPGVSTKVNDDGTDEPTSTVERKQSHKKKHKKESPVDESTDEQALTQEESKPTKKKHKKKKKKRKSSISSDEGSSGGRNADNEEETITISYSEQKKAAQDIEEQSSAKKKHKTTPYKSKQVKEMTSEEKRVKFGTKNHSKSYKASMKALKTVKHTPNKTPDHGILRSKITSPASEGAQSKKKKSRKKNRKSTGSL